MIVLLVNFNFYKGEKKKLFGFIPIFWGEYDDFDIWWYYNVGATLCTVLAMNVFVDHTEDIIVVFKTMVFRLWDRSFGWRISKKENDEDIKVKTKKKTQSELNDLYTGPQMESFIVYANIFSNLWSCLMFSSGLPVLYIVATIFFMSLYWVQKIMLLKVYQRTSSFNEDLALTAIGYIKIGLLFHVLIGVFMYTNNAIISTSISEDIEYGT